MRQGKERGERVREGPKEKEQRMRQGKEKGGESEVTKTEGRWQAAKNTESGVPEAGHGSSHRRRSFAQPVRCSVSCSGGERIVKGKVGWGLKGVEDRRQAHLSVRCGQSKRFQSKELDVSNIVCERERGAAYTARKEAGVLVPGKR